MAERKPIISFRNFSFQYRAQKRPTLTDIDLEIYPGERVLIAGPSGSGKSTPSPAMPPSWWASRTTSAMRRTSFRAGRSSG